MADNLLRTAKKASDTIDATEASTVTSSPIPKKADSISAYQKRLSLKQYPAWFIGFLAFTAMMLPVSLIHESGHILMCDSLGGTGKFLSIFSSDCSGIDNKMTFVRYAGGLFAAGVCATVLIALREYLHPGILIALISYIAWESSMGILEGSMFDFYTTLTADRLMSAIAVAAGVIAWLYFRQSLKLTWQKR